MLSNYIKLAWRILARKKFFTFISLFGISFTLGILMVALSFLQSELGSNAPLSNKTDIVFVPGLRLQKIHYDTITTIDTILTNSIEVYDTTYEYNRRGTMRWNSEFNNNLLEDRMSDLEHAFDRTIFNAGAKHDVFVNGIKLTLNTLYGDPNYWNVFDHEIIKGRVFDDAEMKNAAKLVVISDKTAQDYFGGKEKAIDNEMFIDGKNYLVIGMYKHFGKMSSFVSPDIVIPYSNLNEDNQDSYYHGFYQVIYLKKESSSIQALKDNINYAGSLIPLDHPSKPAGYNEIVLQPETYNEMFASAVYSDEDSSKSLSIMKWVLLSLLLFFILLPTLNLINLNISRILERSAEIGVRKAFGAHQSNIISQFIIENIMQTLIGGTLGLALALCVISIINNGGYLGSAVLKLNPKFFIYSFITILVFGVLSGLLPAYRMSKLQIVNALKENSL
jgi:putative ABC transport system permease protein